MNLISIKLQLFLRDSINPQRLNGQYITRKEFKTWETFLSTEIAKIQLTVQNTSTLSERRTIPSVISQVTYLSDIIYRYMVKDLPIWKNYEQASEIKAHFLYSINLLENLVNVIYERYPIYSAKARISMFRAAGVKLQLKNDLSYLRAIIKNSSVNEELQNVLLNGLDALINKKNQLNSDEHYIRSLINVITNQNDLHDQSLVGLLIMHNFNLPEFFLYCVNNWQKRLESISGLHEQREMLLKEKNLLYHFKIVKSGMIFPWIYTAS